jgi:hypothetical protein
MKHCVAPAHRSDQRVDIAHIACGMLHGELFNVYEVRGAASQNSYGDSALQKCSGKIRADKSRSAQRVESSTRDENIFHEDEINGSQINPLT